MVDNIILKLTTNEYLDSFSNEELWQQAGKAKLTEMLKKTSDEAFNYKLKRAGQNGKKPIYAAHNAICISGERGAGKTVFLRNVQAIWLNACDKTNKTSKDDIHFLEIIDPTLLSGHDQFANVIVAQLYNAVEERLQLSSIEQCRRNDFYSSLQDLANALGKTKEFKDYSGIDKILKYSSGVQIERLFHDFVEKCIDILGCKAIAIPIDDVDMALNKAFEVLDEVRRLLSCPYIITIISGSHHLYSHMTQVHFEKLSAPKGLVDDKTLNEGFDTAKSLTEAYLTKVFPNHQRLPLLPLEDLLPSLRISEDENDNKGITFAEYEKLLQGYFYYLCNGEARSTQWPQPQNAREVSQLIRSLPPSSYKDKSADYLWSTFQSWAEQKQDGVAYSNAITFQQLLNNTQTQSLNIEQLLAFNPKQQVHAKFSGVKKNFFKEQSAAIRELSENEYDNVKLLESVFNSDSYVLRSMPPLEFYTSHMYITKKTMNASTCSFLKTIYLNCDYYGTLSNQIYNIYFSRAFEILTLSILSITSSMKIDWNKQLDNIIKRPPFYSINAMNPNKFLDDINDIRQENDEDEQVNMPELTEESLFTSIFAKQIYEWQSEFKEHLLQMQTKNLIPLLHSVFNKVFTQLHKFRSKEANLKSDEHLSDIVKRFEYLVINAFACFLNTGNIVHANPALSAEVSTIRDIKLFKRKDRVVTKNIEGLVNFDTKAPIDSANIASILLSAIWKHPLFDENNSESITYKIGPEMNTNEEHNEWDEYYRIKQIVVEKYGDFSVKSLNLWVKTQSVQQLRKVLSQLREDIRFTPYKTQKNVLSMTKREEFPRLYITIYNYIYQK